MVERNRTKSGAAPLLLNKISLKQSHIVLQDVDGSEVSVTLDDAMDLYQFVKDRLQEIEKRKKRTGKPTLPQWTDKLWLTIPQNSIANL